MAARRRIYESKYRPLRHKLFAHKQAADHADVEALFAKTNIRELQQLMVFLTRFHEALWQLLHNGRKPNLRPARYSVKRMREQPSPEHRRHAVQERLIHETEHFLKSLAPMAQHGVPGDAPHKVRRAIGAADYHPLSVRRFAPAIKRLQRTVVHASKLARPPAADPQPR